MGDSDCVDLTAGSNADCWCGSNTYPTDPNGDCHATEDLTNNFIAIRKLTEGSNVVYAEYQTGDQSTENVEFDNVTFVEYYDLATDHVQLKNKAKSAPKEEMQPLSDRVHTWFRCAGKACP